MDWNNEWHKIIGILGTTTYLISYFMAQVGAIRVRSYLYCLSNIAAASLVGVSLFFDFNLASSLLQASWILISLIGLAKVNNHKSKHRRPMTRKINSAATYKPNRATTQRQINYLTEHRDLNRSRTVQPSFQ